MGVNRSGHVHVDGVRLHLVGCDACSDIDLSVCVCVCGTVYVPFLSNINHHHRDDNLLI